MQNMFYQVYLKARKKHKYKGEKEYIVVILEYLKKNTTLNRKWHALKLDFVKLLR